MDAMGLLLFYLLGLAVTLVVLYFVIKAAVTEGMKQHTRWQVANRDEIESTYAKRPA